MNRLGINFSISRCNKRLDAVKKEFQFYADEWNAHAESVKLLEQALISAEESDQHIGDAGKLKASALVFPSMYQFVHAKTFKSELRYRIIWQQKQWDAANKLTSFYHAKLKYLEEKLALLEIQKDIAPPPELDPGLRAKQGFI
ncbi:hypothetical protein CBE37_01640 [bacterium TMED277]|nr:MAG: hypothetical protein CBE37_01640 [bacterium TMED277]|tara:strand:+ start:729 stop:1157 length:429 start_codon:yes stop_codon:yes gene_type:complete